MSESNATVFEQALRAFSAAQSISPAFRSRCLVPKQVATDDCVLASRAAAGDRRAFAALMTAHKEALYRFIRRRSADPEEAYDIVQEAFVSAWRAIGRFDGERSFGAWLRAIALNKCRDQARRAAARRSLRGFSAEGAVERLADEHPSPEEDLIARDALHELRRALVSLPDYLRNALMLTTVDGLSQAAAGAILGCSEKSVEYRVCRAREMLRGLLRAHHGRARPLLVSGKEDLSVP